MAGWIALKPADPVGVTAWNVAGEIFIPVVIPHASNHASSAIG